MGLEINNAGSSADLYSDGATTSLTYQSSQIGVFSLENPTSTSATVLFNYTKIGSAAISTAQAENYLLYGTGFNGEVFWIYWTRARAYPPNDVMPGVIPFTVHWLLESFRVIRARTCSDSV